MAQCLSDQTLTALLPSLTIGTNVAIEWAFHEEPEDITREEGTVIAVGQSSVEILWATSGRHTFPPSPDVLVFGFKTLSTHSISYLPPLDFQTRPLSGHKRVIFFDGGCETRSGAGSCGIVVRDYQVSQQSPPSTSASVYLPSTTNNIAEYCGLVGALRLVSRDDQETIIIGDSALVIQQLLGRARCTCPHLIPLLTVARGIYSEVAHRVTIGHMYRNLGNPADEVCKSAMRLGKGCGDESLFPAAPVPPPKTSRGVPKPVSLPVQLHPATLPTTIDSFAELRALKSLRSCPAGALPAWATLVRGHLSAVLSASNMADRDEAMMRLIILPTAFLPVNVSHRRIVDHVTAAKPFGLRIGQDETHKPADRSDDKRDRLSKSVERMALDKNVKGAISLLNSGEDTMSFEEKLTALQRKFPPRSRQLPFCMTNTTAPAADTVNTPVNTSSSSSSNALVAPPPPSSTTPPFTARAVRTCLRKLHKQAATAIDGWTRALWQQAIAFEPTVGDDLGSLLAQIVDRQFGEFVMECLRLGRGVAIPKPDGGIRPIVISSSFLRLAGTACVLRSGMKNSTSQYATSHPRGCERVVHECRRAIANGKAVVKVDISNAFNSIPRAVIADLIDLSTDIGRYFITVYGPSSSIAVFGPEGKVAFIEANEGVRQGDAASMLLFCSGIDKVMTTCHSELGAGGVAPQVQMKAFADDISSICDPNKVEEVSVALINSITALGLEVNVEKSSVYCASSTNGTTFAL